MWASYHDGKKTKSYVTLHYVTLYFRALLQVMVKIWIFKYAEFKDGKTTWNVLIFEQNHTVCTVCHCREVTTQINIQAVRDLGKCKFSFKKKKKKGSMTTIKLQVYVGFSRGRKNITFTLVRTVL